MFILDKSHSKPPKCKSVLQVVSEPSRVTAGKQCESTCCWHTRKYASRSPTPSVPVAEKVPSSDEEPRRRAMKPIAVTRLRSERSDRGQFTPSLMRWGGGPHMPRDILACVQFGSIRVSSPAHSIRFADQPSPSGTHTPFIPAHRLQIRHTRTRPAKTFLIVATLNSIKGTLMTGTLCVLTVIVFVIISKCRCSHAVKELLSDHSKGPEFLAIYVAQYPSKNTVIQSTNISAHEVIPI